MKSKQQRAHGRRPKRGRRNPVQKKSSWPWVAGLIGAGVGLGVAWKVWGSGAPQQPQVPQHPQIPQQRFAPAPYQVAPPMLQGMEGPPPTQFDRHGIPVVSLPGESAARTQQARMFMTAAQGPGVVPSLDGHQVVMDPNTGQQVLQAVPVGSPQQQESFGGDAAGNFGGERF